jgi:predicted transposase YdaD
MRHTRLTNTIEIAKNFLSEGTSIDTIVKATGLTREEVERLRSTKNEL